LKEKITEPNAIVIGISFGGMLVTEMAKKDAKIKAIILSSAKTSKEIPFYYKIGKYLPLFKWIPDGWFRSLIKSSRWILGGKNKLEKEILNNIVSETDIGFTKWAVEAILHWDNHDVPSNLIHIHGTSDKLIPHRFVEPDHLVRGGTHVMTLDNHTEVSNLLNSLLKANN
jgi:pimeloyl-ACP methyl ester carboxylesterase